MKNILYILLLISVSVFGENRQKEIDSLRIILKTSKQDTARVNLLNAISENFISQDQYDSAIFFASQSQNLAQRLRFKSGESAALRRIGVSYSEQGELPKALEYFFQALKIKESREVDKININIGAVYYKQNDFDAALKYYLEANELSGIGTVYLSKADYENALLYYNKALLENESQNKNAIILLNIGTAYELKNDYGKALQYYFKALKIKEEINDNQGICDALASIGDVYYKQKKYNESIEYENKSLEIARQINYVISVRETERVLSEIYEQLGDGTKSLEHYKNYIAVRDSMFNEENTKRTVRAEMNFDFEKKQERIKAEQDKKDAVQKTIRNSIATGLGLVIIFSIFLFRSNKQVKKKNIEIEKQKKEVEHQKKEITDNINYAKNIQKAMLPSDDYIKNNLPENFLIYKPKDIVSGDFYWTYKDGETIYWATADCTGHGVSGAMMSMIGASLLNEIVIERKITSPELVLNTLREEIIRSINQQGAAEERKDGMDIVFCKLYQDNSGNEMTLECACANNPIYIVRNGRVIKLDANRMPVGKYITDESFTLNGFQLQKNDIIYTFSDGFCDQFSSTGKKLMTKRFKDWLSELSVLPMNEIKTELEKRFEDWKNGSEQIDDVTIFAVKI